MNENPAFTAYDLESEQALLGWAMIENRIVPTIFGGLRPADFYEPLHQEISTLIVDLDEQQKPITPLTLNGWLKHYPAYKEVGGVEYLANLCGSAPAFGSIDDARGMALDRAQHIAELARRREAERVLTEALEGLRQGRGLAQSLTDVSAFADEQIGRQESSQNITSAGDATISILNRIERQAVDPKPVGCPTGLTLLDEAIGGLIPARLIIIGGRPGMGKSILATTICRAAARAGWSPDYYSLEMPADEVAARLIADVDYENAIATNRTPLAFSRLIRLQATGPELTRAAEAQLALTELDISIMDKETVTMASACGLARARASASKKRKLFVFDHLGLIEPDDRYKGRKVDEIAEVTKAGKRLARRTGAPVVMLCQLNRKVEERDDKRPVIGDFRDSGAIEQDADVMLGLYRHAYYAQQELRQAKTAEQKTRAESEMDQNKDNLEIGVLKNRAGEAPVSIQVFISVRSSAVRDCRPTSDGGMQGLL